MITHKQIDGRWCLSTWERGTTVIIHHHPDREEDSCGETGREDNGFVVRKGKEGKLPRCELCHEPAPQYVLDVAILAGVKISEPPY